MKKLEKKRKIMFSSMQYLIMEGYIYHFFFFLLAFIKNKKKILQPYSYFAYATTIKGGRIKDAGSKIFKETCAM